MPVLELTRAPDARRTYELAGAGRIALRGVLGRAATAEDGRGTRWELARRGVFRTVIEATDAAGGVAAGFRAGRSLRGGGTVVVGGRELALRPSSVWRQRYALADGETELATFEGKGWGKRPVKVTLPDAGEPPAPLVLLFTAFVVKSLAEDAIAVAAST
jgi:hypothetical protein